jgi:hypothetical protein
VANTRGLTCIKKETQLLGVTARIKVGFLAEDKNRIDSGVQINRWPRDK